MQFPLAEIFLLQWIILCVNNVFKSSDLRRMFGWHVEMLLGCSVLDQPSFQSESVYQ